MLRLPASTRIFPCAEVADMRRSFDGLAFMAREVKRLPKQSGEYLLEVVLRRHELRATIMTSNRPLDDWGKLIGDVPSATAILDRFLHHAEVIQITGRSYRLRNRAGAASQKKTDDQACKDQ